MAKLGPKLKLTTDLQDKILLCLRGGNYVETACAVAGIHKDTFYEWMKLGKGGMEPYASFRTSVTQALAKGEVRDLALIGQAARTQWQAAAWRLERRFPERWGRSERVMALLEEELHRAVERLQGKLSPDEFKRAASALADDEGSPPDPGEPT